MFSYLCVAAQLIDCAQSIGMREMRTAIDNHIGAALGQILYQGSQAVLVGVRRNDGTE